MGSRIVCYQLEYKKYLTLSLNRDDLEKLDFEIECFLLENWTKQVHNETGKILVLRIFRE